MFFKVGLEKCGQLRSKVRATECGKLRKVINVDVVDNMRYVMGSSSAFLSDCTACFFYFFLQ